MPFRSDCHATGRTPPVASFTHSHRDYGARITPALRVEGQACRGSPASLLKQQCRKKILRTAAGSKDSEKHAMGISCYKTAPERCAAQRNEHILLHDTRTMLGVHNVDCSIDP